MTTNGNERGTAVVTGGAGGLGSAYTRALLAEGWSVVVADRDEDGGRALVAELGERTSFARLDVTSEQDWRALADSLGDRTVTVLVNNAGRHAFGGVSTTDVDVWRSVLDINVTGAFLGIATFAPGMPAGSTIVNISSTCGIVGYADQAAYVASKWAVRGLTRAAAMDLRAQGIRVFTIVPGPFATPMTEPFAETLRELVTSQPIPRVGDPSEAAELLAFLCTRATYSTGSDFFVDGGAMTGVVLPDA